MRTLYIILSLILCYACATEEVTMFNPVAPDDASIEQNILKGKISQDLDLSSSKEWILEGRVSVIDSSILTIPAGTIIKAMPGTGADASVLIIARGSKLIAKGTQYDPIIFQPIQGDVKGLWGGVIVLGSAPVSFSGDVQEMQIEGIPVSDTSGLYGGSNTEDSSGSIEYVSIRYGGAEIGEDNEINGLTLGGVGSLTTVRNIEVVANLDDGIEFFGGSVNASNLMVWGQGDDAIDIDQGYSGTIDNVLVALTGASDHAFEIDGPEGSLMGSFSINNATLIGATSDCESLGTDGEMMDFRKGARGSLDSIFIKNFAYGKDIELDAAADADNYAAGILNFSNIAIQQLEGCENEGLELIFDDKSNTSTFSEDASGFAKIVTEKEYGASDVFGWTLYIKHYEKETK